MRDNPGVVCTYSRHTICAERRRPWRAILALMMPGSQNASIAPRARSRNRSCPASPARSTITRKRMKEKRAVLDGVAAELQRIIGEPATEGHRTGSSSARCQIDGNRNYRFWPAPVSTSLAGPCVLKHPETRHLAAGALTRCSVLVSAPGQTQRARPARDLTK